jgi:uncharacterized protein
MPAVFLTAEWRKLAMANYPVDPASLEPFLPPRTELDSWQDETYVSLVGFEFRDIRVKRFSIPFHRNFPEVNLRFYVRHKSEGHWKRGVVFIREIVPLPAVSFIANTVFRERYISLPMRTEAAQSENHQQIGFAWKYKGHWNHIRVTTANQPVPLQQNSQEEFITEHFWGYAKAGDDRTNEYQVAHPRWDIYPVDRYHIDCDFAALYGQAFDDLTRRKPQSVFLAEGSPIDVYGKTSI